MTTRERADKLLVDLLDVNNARRLPDIIEQAITAAIKEDRERCIAAINAEDEYPGDMPDEMWNFMRDDRGLATEALRVTVGLVKRGILDRMGKP